MVKSLEADSAIRALDIPPPFAIPRSQEETLISVFRNGLLSGKELRNRHVPYIGSFDNPPKNIVFGNIVRANLFTLDENLRKALQDEHNAVFPALAERFGENPQSNLTIDNHFSRLLCASILVICELDNIPGVQRGEDETGLVSPAVPASSFHTVVFPEAVAENTTIPCGEFHVATVGYIPKRINGFFGDVEVIVPNYEKAIRDVIINTQKNLWISGVRLNPL